MKRHLWGFTLALLSAVGCAQAKTPLTSSTGSAGTGTAAASAGSTSGNGTSSGSTSGGGTSGSTTGNSSGGTSGGTTGTPCITAVNCAGLIPRGQVCLDGGVCGEPTAPSSICTPVGMACGTTEPSCCAGPCDGGTCTPWSACGNLGASCLGSNDCCAYDACDGGSCATSCASIGASCEQDTDCCLEYGLLCLPEGDAGRPRHCDAPLTATCQSNGTPQCNLGTYCTISASGDDPCAPAGYVCDPFYRACRSPFEYESCLVGGPACQPIPDSNASTICVGLLAGNQTTFLCLQPCSTTSDCVDPTMTCTNVLGGQACFTDVGCIDLFQACDSSGTGDGTCIPFTYPDQVQGQCWQGFADGGPGCAIYGNRQNGGLCPVGEYCLGGLCQPYCNAGTEDTPGCDGGTYCQWLYQTGNPIDVGACAQACAIADLDGGGCLASPLPEKCLPLFFYGLPDNGSGVCVQESHNAPAIGQPCTTDRSVLADSCGQAALCGGLNGTIRCLQICDDIGQQGSCPDGKSCETSYSNGQSSTTTGVCGP